MKSVERNFLFDAINLRWVITASVLQEDFLITTKLTENKAEKFKKCRNKNFKTIMQDAVTITAMPVWRFKIPPALRCDITCIKSIAFSPFFSSMPRTDRYFWGKAELDFFRSFQAITIFKLPLKEKGQNLFSYWHN